MRVALVYPERAVWWPKFAWVADAARRLGHDTRIVRKASELAEADAWADVILFEHKSPCMAPADVLRISTGRKARWVQWWFDLVATDPGRRLADQELMRSFLPIMRAMDEVLVREAGLLGEYRALCINARWLDQGCPADLAACEHRETPEWDVLLWGQANGYRQRRADARALADAGFKVAWATHYGDLPPGVMGLIYCPAMALPKLASRAAVTLCVDLRHDLRGYWSDRLWLALGMGACVVRRDTPGLNPALPLYTYQDTAGMIDLVGSLRSDVEHRRAIGAVAREYVMGAHTYEHRIAELLEQI